LQQQTHELGGHCDCTARVRRRRALQQQSGSLLTRDTRLCHFPHRKLAAALAISTAASKQCGHWRRRSASRRQRQQPRHPPQALQQ
jgi:hypothetical protein